MTTTTTKTAYKIFPIADEHCDRLSTDREPLAVADTYEAAQAAASELSGGYPYGVGILEVATGALDVGFGLGVQANVEAWWIDDDADDDYPFAVEDAEGDDQA